MIVTATDARSGIEDLLVLYINDRLDALDLQIRADMAATGPAPDDDDAEAVPADPDAPWCRISVEDIVLLERARLEAWRDQLLARFDRQR